LVRLHKPPHPRLYRGAGFAVPSVTEVLSVAERRPFEAWRRKVGRKEAHRVMDEAKILGTKVHTLAQLLAHDPKTPVDDEMEMYGVAIKEFHAVHVKRVLGTEMGFTSQKLGFGGTCDLYCELADGTRAVVDYKTTGGGLTREHGLQLAGYALLLKEHGYMVNRRICVRLRKDEPGRWYARVYRDHSEDVAAFMACVTLWTWMHKKKLLEAVEAA
jgi:predicted RecB family nuclease